MYTSNFMKLVDLKGQTDPEETTVATCTHHHYEMDQGKKHRLLNIIVDQMGLTDMSGVFHTATVGHTFELKRK